MKGRKRWERLPVAALVVAVAGTVTIAATGSNDPVEGLDFAQAGHWVANHDLDVAFHVNGGSKSVDAKAPVAIDPGDRVYQGDTSAYVVGDSRIREFGESTLKVERTIETPTGERPVGVEAAAGPYLVYQEAGTVVRLGPEPATIDAGKGLGNPVVTPDGTLWLHRQSSGVLCRLAKNTDQLSCPMTTQRGHGGQLTVVDRQPAFVDTTDDTVRPIADDELGDPVNIGSDIPATVQIGSADADGRIPMLDPDNHRLHLVDARGLPGETDDTEPPPAAPPVEIDLPDGDYAKPEASGNSVVLLDRAGNSVRTYAPDGTDQGITPVPEETGEPTLTRGEDARVYVDGDKGSHVMVVDDDGTTTQIPLVGDDRDKDENGPQAPPPDRRGEGRDERDADEPDPSNQDRQVVAEAPQNRPAQPQAPPPQTDEQPAPPPANTPPPASTPPPPPPPPPPPAPASPPGVAANLRAAPQGNAVRVTWATAAPNGAPVTAYHVSWQPPTGGGSRTLPGNARSTVLSGLEPGVAYTITVVAENKAGRGAPATTQAALPPVDQPTVTVTRGRTEANDNCPAPQCGLMKFTLENFEPNTDYTITPYSDNPDYHGDNPEDGATTDGDGRYQDEAFPFPYIGSQVWVVVTGPDGQQYESPHYTWPEG